FKKIASWDFCLKTIFLNPVSYEILQIRSLWFFAKIGGLICCIGKTTQRDFISIRKKPFRAHFLPLGVAAKIAKAAIKFTLLSHLASNLEPWFDLRSWPW
ncbi:hypothetical protein, partial [Meiothermus cerbereus]|uniref:hypothetical protein n=1 Tax=Meiothermus cerbereus TaxID=65552 RepID=UPI003EEF3E88